MPRQTVITDLDEIRWALDKVFPDIRTEYFPSLCILTGNEDAPEKLEFWLQSEPLITDVPFIVINFPQ